MNKLRFLFVIAMCSLLIASSNLVGIADQWQETDADSLEMSFHGNVKIRGTPSGHITIAVDKTNPLGGTQADGLWDVVFHFAPKKFRHENTNIFFDLENATLVSTGRRLTVLSNERYILLNLTLEKSIQSNGWIPYYNDRSRDLAETVRISRGLALGQYQGSMESIEGFWSCGSVGGKCSVRERNEGIRTMDVEPELPPDCPSGGSGASSCGISCGGGQGCNVTCGSGTYACCHCTNGCHCIKN
jgi:hypothetical protein